MKDKEKLIYENELLNKEVRELRYKLAIMKKGLRQASDIFEQCNYHIIAEGIDELLKTV